MAKKTVFSKTAQPLVTEDTKDLHTKDGVLTSEQLKKGGHFTSNKNAEFFITPSGFPDLLLKIKRGPAIMVPKDIGAIIAHTGVCEGWKVVDAGAGCGVLTSYLSRIIGSKTKLVSYEKREEFLKIAQANLTFLGINNVTLKHKDVYDGIEEKDLDLITLDLTEPWRVLGHASASLKRGGYLVAYVPTVSQIIELVKQVNEHDF